MKFKLIMLISFLINIFRVANAQVLFEGYSKVTLSGQYIGFIIQRYEYNLQKKQFVSLSMSQYNEMANSVSESLVAYANEALEPISYVYNSATPTKSHTIEGKLEKGKLKIVTTSRQVTPEKNKVFNTEKAGKSKQTIKGKDAKDKPKSNLNEIVNIKEIPLPKGAFFSTFLAYVILRNPNGMKTSTEYIYKAVAEEDGNIYDGKAVIQSEESFKGLKVFKILNTYKGDSFITLTTSKGEMVASSAPQKTLSLELVSDPSSAIMGMSVSPDNLKLIFGDIPEGKVNPLSVSLATDSGKINKVDQVKSFELQTPPKTSEPGKQGARKGLGIQTKSK